MSYLLHTVCLIVTAVHARIRHPSWKDLSSNYSYEHFADDFGRAQFVTKGSEEWSRRKQNFEAMLSMVLAHNADPSASYTMAINDFSDWSAEEWKNYNKAKFRTVTYQENPNNTIPLKDCPVYVPSKFKTCPVKIRSSPPPASLPKEVDLRKGNLLTGVKNQGQCGSCWAFSAIESLESQIQLTFGKLPVISPQQVTACTKGSFGCRGGYPLTPWLYLDNTFSGYWGSKHSGEVFSEWEYPYTDFYNGYIDPKGTGAKCINLRYGRGVPISVEAWVLPSNRADMLMDALANVGPISVVVAASGRWQSYGTGILKLTPKELNSSKNWDLDHAVQAVGYGYDDDAQEGYWIVRNSWGAYWGEAGYIRLWRATGKEKEPCHRRGKRKTYCGTFGILTAPSFPKVHKL